MFNTTIFELCIKQRQSQTSQPFSNNLKDKFSHISLDCFGLNLSPKSLLNFLSNLNHSWEGYLDSNFIFPAITLFVRKSTIPPLFLNELPFFKVIKIIHRSEKQYSFLIVSLLLQNVERF